MSDFFIIRCQQIEKNCQANIWHCSVLKVVLYSGRRPITND